MASPLCTPSGIQELKGFESGPEGQSVRVGLQRPLHLSLLQLGVDCRIDQDAVTLSRRTKKNSSRRKS
jgi:hypothetical protein